MIQILRIILISMLIVSCENSGVVKSWFSNGKPEVILHYQKSNDTTNYTKSLYFENGNRRQEIHYIKYQIDGEIKEWYESGKIKKVVKYENGKPKNYTEWYPNGQKEKEGVLIAIDTITIKDPNGLCDSIAIPEIRQNATEWYRNGKIKARYMVNSNGKMVVNNWDENGDLINNHTDTNKIMNTTSPLLKYFMCKNLPWTEEELKTHINRKSQSLFVSSKSINKGLMTIKLSGVLEAGKYAGNVEIQQNRIMLYNWIPNVESTVKAIVRYEFIYEIELPDPSIEYEIVIISL